MDKITKFLKKLNKDELLLIHRALEQLTKGDVKNLDIKKLKGFDDVYRVRVRNIRIIYSHANDTIKLIEISRRNEETYKKY